MERCASIFALNEFEFGSRGRSPHRFSLRLNWLSTFGPLSRHSLGGDGSTLDLGSLIHVHHGRGREPVEIRRGGVTVGADLFAVKQVAQLQIVRQVLRH